MKSIKDKLLHKIQTEGRLSYGAMCQYVAERGKKVSYAERELRRLVEEGKIHNEWSKTTDGKTTYISGYTAEPVDKPKKSTVEIVMINGKPVAQEIYA